MHTANVQLVGTQGQAGDKLRMRTWIEVQLIGEDDSPISGEAYAIALPGGKVVEGWLDANGLARIEGIAGGICLVSFPKLDKDAWVPVETQSSSEAAAA
jgi:hypothetical protein